MSYILDALRRADAERERGHVPGIHAQPTRMASMPSGVGRPSNKVRLGYVAGIPLVLLLGWLTWRVASTDTSAPVGSSGATPASGLPTLAATVPATSGPAAAVPVPFAPAPTAPAPTVVLPTPSRSTPGESPGSQAQATLSDRPAARPNSERGKPSPTVALPSRSASASGSAASRRALAEAGVASSASPPPKVYALDELPEDVRRELPRLAIGGSIYSESAASRFVIVNGQLCHEGDTLAPGLVLQQIKLRSAVLAFRGYRYAISF